MNRASYPMFNNCLQVQSAKSSQSPRFKVLRWLPIIAFAEQFLVGDISATGQEAADIAHGFAVQTQRLADITAHWKCRMNAFSAMKRFRDLPSVGVIGFWDDCRDH